MKPSTACRGLLAQYTYATTDGTDLTGYDVKTTSTLVSAINHGYQCDYMAKRVHIKHKYNLTMSAWEKDETIAFLTQCATQ